MDARAEPLALAAWCETRLGRPAEALAAARGAVRRDPGSWVVHYVRAAAEEAGGRDPAEALRAARRRNPQDPRTAAGADLTRTPFEEMQ